MISEPFYMMETQLTDEQYREFMRVVALASVTNRIAIGYQIEPDERYRTPAS